MFAFGDTSACWRLLILMSCWHGFFCGKSQCVRDLIDFSMFHSDCITQWPGERQTEIIAGNWSLPEDRIVLHAHCVADRTVQKFIARALIIRTVPFSGFDICIMNTQLSNGHPDENPPLKLVCFFFFFKFRPVRMRQAHFLNWYSNKNPFWFHVHFKRKSKWQKHHFELWHTQSFFFSSSHPIVL